MNKSDYTLQKTRVYVFRILRILTIPNCSESRQIPDESARKIHAILRNDIFIVFIKKYGIVMKPNLANILERIALNYIYKLKKFLCELFEDLFVNMFILGSFN